MTIASVASTQSPNANHAINAMRANVARALAAFMPPASVLTAPEDLRPYECDGLSVYRALPMIAVLPATTAEVQRILQIASAEKAKVVARGAGTGLSGGATPLGDGVLLSLAKFNRIKKN